MACPGETHIKHMLNLVTKPIFHVHGVIPGSLGSDAHGITNPGVVSSSIGLATLLQL